MRAASNPTLGRALVRAARPAASSSVVNSFRESKQLPQPAVALGVLAYHLFGWVLGINDGRRRGILRFWFLGGHLEPVVFIHCHHTLYLAWCKGHGARVVSFCHEIIQGVILLLMNNSV
jgi:hypothetical protein